MPAAAARSERSQARRAAASTVGNRQGRRRRLVVRVSPKPSNSGGAPIKRAEGDDSEVQSEGASLTPRNVVTASNIYPTATATALCVISRARCLRTVLVIHGRANAAREAGVASATPAADDFGSCASTRSRRQPRWGTRRSGQTLSASPQA